MSLVEFKLNLFPYKFEFQAQDEYLLFSNATMDSWTVWTTISLNVYAQMCFAEFISHLLYKNMQQDKWAKFPVAQQIFLQQN